MKNLTPVAGAIALGLLIAGPASAQAQTDLPLYGAPIILEDARTVMNEAEEVARENKWPVAIAIVDAGGHLVLAARHDNTQLSAMDLAIGKARTAIMFKRPSKALDDVVAAGGGGMRFLALPGITPLEGGFPIVQDGKIVGAIGVAGSLASQNSKIGQAGAEALKATDTTAPDSGKPAEK